MRSLPVPEVRRLSRAGEAALLDIREDYEAATARVQGAIALPLGLLLADPERARLGRPVIVIDHEGTRSRFAASYLREHGVDARPAEGGALALLHE